MKLEDWKYFAKTSIAGIIGASPIAYFLDYSLEMYLTLALLGVSIILVGGLMMIGLEAIDSGS